MHRALGPIHPELRGLSPAARAVVRMRHQSIKRAALERLVNSYYQPLHDFTSPRSRLSTMTGSELGAPTGMRTMSALLILGLASMPAILAHGPVAGKCACEAGEADHPFTISCADKTTIATAATTLTACTKTKAACAAETNGLMICQQAFFILQAHHSFCGHETLTTVRNDRIIYYIS